MQALMEAASVAGASERKCRADLAKCLWLLTLDDVNGQQRLARTFESRVSRVRSEVFLPWLPNLIASLLRPEGRFIVSALKGVIGSHPTVLYGYLRGLQHQLTNEVTNDQKLADLVHQLDSDVETNQLNEDEFVKQTRVRIQTILGLEKHILFKNLDRTRLGLDSSNDLSIGATNSNSIETGLFSAPPSSKTSEEYSTLTSSSSTNHNSNNNSLVFNSGPNAQTNLSKKKKRVIVVMRGVEGERLTKSPNTSPPPTPQSSMTDQKSIQNQRSTTNQPKKVIIRGPESPLTSDPSRSHEMDETGDEDIDEDQDVFDLDDREDDEDNDVLNSDNPIHSSQPDRLRNVSSIESDDRTNKLMKSPFVDSDDPMNDNGNENSKLSTDGSMGRIGPTDEIGRAHV